MKKKIHMIAALLAMLPTMLWAGGTTYYAAIKANVSSSGGGKVYASTSDSETSSYYGDSSKATAKGSSKVNGNSASITLYAFAKADYGYKLSGWSKTDGGTILSTSSVNPYPITITSSNTSSSPTPEQYYAVFEPNTSYVVSLVNPEFGVSSYTVTGPTGFSGSGLSNGGDMDAYAGESYSFICTVADGYEFVKWTVNGADAGTSTTLTKTFSSASTVQAVVNKLVTYYATCLPAPAGCSYKVGSTTVSGTEQQVSGYGTLSVTLSAPTAANGYLFAGWYTIEDGNKTIFSTDSSTTVTKKADVTLGADFVAITAPVMLMTTAGTVDYDDFDAAFAAAKSGDKIKVVANGTLTADAYVNPGVTLDVAAGVTLTVASGATLYIDGNASVNGTISGTVSKCTKLIQQAGDGSVDAETGKPNPFNPYGTAKYWKTTTSTPSISVSGSTTHTTLVNGYGDAFRTTEVTSSSTFIFVNVDTSKAVNHITGIKSISTVKNILTATISGGMAVLVSSSCVINGGTTSKTTFTGRIDAAGQTLYSVSGVEVSNGGASYLLNCPSFTMRKSVGNNFSFYNCNSVTFSSFNAGGTVRLYFYDCGTKTSPASYSASFTKGPGDDAFFYFYSGYYNSITYKTGYKVYGGSYKSDPSNNNGATNNYLADTDHLEAKYDGSTYYVVQEKKDPVYVAAIGTTQYETLPDAIAAAGTGATIDLVGPVDLTGTTVEVPSGKNITIALNKHSITGGKLTNKGVLVLADSTINCEGVVQSDIENTGTLDLVFGTYSGSIVNKAGTLTTHNGVFNGTVSKVGGTIDFKGGHFTQDVSDFVVVDGYDVVKDGDGKFCVCELPNGTMYDTTVSSTAGYGATPYSDEDFNLLYSRVKNSKTQRSDYSSDANWKRLAQLLNFYQVFNNNGLDATIVFDRDVTAKSINLYAKSTASMTVDFKYDLPAGQLYRALSEVVVFTYGNYAKTYFSLFDDNIKSVALAISDKSGSNKGTVCKAMVELWKDDRASDYSSTGRKVTNTVYVVGQKLFTLDAGSNKAMIRPATGAATFYSTLGAAMNAVADGGTVMLANDCDATLPLDKEGTYTLDTMGFAYSGGEPAVDSGLRITSVTTNAVNSSAKVLVPDALTITYVVADGRTIESAGLKYATVAEAIGASAGNAIAVTVTANDTETVTLPQGKTLTVTVNDGVTANVTVEVPEGSFLVTTAGAGSTTYESKKITVEMAEPQTAVAVTKIENGATNEVSDAAVINAAVAQLTGNHDVPRTDNTDKLDVLDKITVTPTKIVEEVVGDKTVIRSATFDVTPALNAGQSLGEGQKLKFRLPVDASATQLAAIVYHGDALFGICPVQTYNDEKFIEAESDAFSPYGYELLDGETENPIAAIGTTGYATLPAAIAAASNGDTITVFPGTFDAGSDTVVVNKSVTITGAGKDTTTLNFTANGTAAFSIQASNVTIENMTINQADKSNDNTCHVRVVAAGSDSCYSNVTLSNLKLGGGKYSMFIYGEAFTIDGCDFSGQGSSQIVVDATKGNSKITNNTFADNGKKYNILQRHSHSPTTVISYGKLTISGNTSTGCGLLYILEDASTIDTTQKMEVEIVGNEVKNYTNKAVAFCPTDELGRYCSAVTITNNAFYTTTANRPVIQRDDADTSSLAIDASGNYWGAATPDFDNPIQSGGSKYLIMPHTDSNVTVDSWYQAYDEDTDTLSNLYVVAVPVAQIVTDGGATTNKYESLEAAIAAVPTDGTATTITMIGDETIEGNAGVTIAASQNVVLDLNGHTVELAVANANAQAYLIQNNGTLTVNDSSTGGRLHTDVGNKNSSGSPAKYTIVNKGALTVNGGKIDATATVTTGTAMAISCDASNSDVSVSVNGGEISSAVGAAINMKSSATYASSLTVTAGTLSGYGTTGSSAIRCTATQAAANLTINISGGVFNGEYAALYVQASNAATREYPNVHTTISGGTFTAGLLTDSHEWALNIGAGEVDITGGTFNYGTLLNAHDIDISGGSFTEDVILYRESGTADASISGGTFGGDIIVGGTSGSVTVDEDTNLYAEGKFISGGTFSEPVPEELCADTYIPTAQDPETGMYSVKVGSYVAQIVTNGGATTNKYETLASAVTAANSGDTIEMIADETLAARVDISKAVTLELNGKTISYAGSAANAVALYVNGGNLTVTNSTGNGAITVTGAGRGIWANGSGAAVTIQAGSVTAPTYGVYAASSATSVTMTGGTVTGGSAAIAGFCPMSVTGGSVIGTTYGIYAKNATASLSVSGDASVAATAATSYAIYSESCNVAISDDASVNGGRTGIYAKGGSLAVSGGEVVVDNASPTAATMPISLVGAECEITGGVVSNSAPVTSYNAYAVYCDDNSGTPSSVSISDTAEIVCVNGFGVMLFDGSSATVEDDATITSHWQCLGNIGTETVGTSITIEGGTMTSDTVALYHPGKGTLTITGGTLTGQTVASIRAGTVAISGGTFVATGEAKEYEYVASGTCNTGDALYIENSNYGGNGAPSVSISGGTFTSANARAVVSYASGSGNEPVDGFVSGGDFTSAVPEEYCATGYIPTAQDPETGMYSVKVGSYVAQIVSNGGATTNKYETLASAISAALDGDTVQLLADSDGDLVGSGTTTAAMTVTADITLDLNGHDITTAATTGAFRFNGSSRIIDSVGGGSLNTRFIDNYGSLVIDGVTYNANGTGGASAIRNFGSSLAVSNSTITVNSQFGITSRAGADDVTIFNSTIQPTASRHDLVALNSESRTDTVIENSTINALFGYRAYRQGSNASPTATAAGSTVVVRGSTVNIVNSLTGDGNGSAAFASFADNVTFTIEDTDITITTSDAEGAAGSYAFGSSNFAEDRACNNITLTVDEDSSITLVGTHSALLTEPTGEPSFLSGEGVDLEVEGDTLKTQFADAGYGMKGVAGKDGWYTPFIAVAQIVVTEGGTTTTNKYELLQTAINAAEDGDTVTLLTDATLTASIAQQFNTGSITIDGAGHTIRPAEGDNAASLYFKGNESDASALAVTITNAVFTGFVNRAVMTEYATLNVTGCTFRDNTVAYDASCHVINCRNSVVGVENSLFEGNTSKSVIYIDSTSSVTVENCLFDGNTCVGNGVIYMAASTTSASITDNTFDSNSVGPAENAAVVYCSAPAEVSGNLFKDNVVNVSGASNKEGVVVLGSAAGGSAITDNAFVGNTLGDTATNRATVWVNDKTAAYAYDVSGNYWDDGELPETGTGKDIYSTGSGTMTATTYATAYTANAEGYGAAVTETPSATYQVWVGGTQITSANAADVFGDGTVSYDSSTATLTLNGYTYSGAGYGSSAVYIGDVGGATFNIVATGDNSLTSTATYGYAIRSVGTGAVTVTGSGTNPSLALTVPSTYDTGYAVSVKGTSATFKDLSMDVTGYLGFVVNGTNTAGDALTIDNCNVVFDGTAIDQAIWVYNPGGDGTVSIENGSSLTGKGAILVYGYGTSAGDANLSISDSTVNLTGATSANSAGRHAIEVLSKVGDSVLTIDNSTVTVTASNPLGSIGNGPDGINVGSQKSVNGKGIAKIDIKNGSVVTATGKANGVNVFTWGDNSSVNPCGTEIVVSDSTLNAIATDTESGLYGIVTYAYKKGDTLVLFTNSTVTATAPVAAGIYVGAGADYNADIGNLSYVAVDSDVSTFGPYGLVVSTATESGDNTDATQTVAITNGTFTCNGMIYVLGDGEGTASLTMSNVTATVVSDDDEGNAAIVAGSLNIDSGTYTIVYDEANSFAFDVVVGNISGGWFNEPVLEELCAEGYIPSTETRDIDGETYYTVKRGAYVAAVYDENFDLVGKYETLYSAVRAADDEYTVELLTNVVESVTINKSIELTGEYTITGRTKIDAGATVVISDVAFDAAGDLYALDIAGGAAVEVSDVTFGGGFWCNVHVNNGSLTGAGVTMIGDAIVVSADGQSFTYRGETLAWDEAPWGLDVRNIPGETLKLPFMDIVREYGTDTVSLGDADGNPLTQSGSILYVANMPGDETLTGVTLPARFGSYSLTLGVDIGFLGNSDTPVTGWTVGDWNGIIDTGAAVLEALDEDSSEVPVELTLNGDTDLGDTPFEFRYPNLTIDGGSNALVGTVIYTDNAGVVGNITLGTEDAPLTIDLTQVTGTVRLGSDVDVSNVTLVLTQEQATSGHPVFTWDPAGDTDGPQHENVSIIVADSASDSQLVWDAENGVAFIGPCEARLTGPTHETPIYTTLADALARAAQSGDTVTLLTNIVESVTIDKSLTLNGGYTLTGRTKITDGAAVAISNLTFDAAGDLYALDIAGGAAVAVTNAAFGGGVWCNVHVNGGSLTGAGVEMVGDDIEVAADGLSYTYRGMTIDAADAPFGMDLDNVKGETVTIPFMDIVRENGDETISLADTDECQLTQGASLLYVANMPGDDNQTGVTLPERFYCYTLTIEANIGFLGDGTTPTTGWTLGDWNGIIDTGSAVLDAIGEDSDEVAVTLTLNGDTDLGDSAFEFRYPNLTIDGGSNTLSGTVIYTDDAGVVGNITLGSEENPLTIDLTGVSGTVQLGGDVDVANVTLVLTPEQATSGHPVFTWDSGDDADGPDHENVTIVVSGTESDAQLVWDAENGVAFIGPCEARLTGPTHEMPIYTTLADALARAAQSGDTVTLLTNVVASVTIDKDLTLNGGYTLTGRTKITDGAAVAISNLTFDAAGDLYALDIAGGAAVAVTNATFGGGVWCNVHVNGGSLTGAGVEMVGDDIEVAADGLSYTYRGLTIDAADAPFGMDLDNVKGETVTIPFMDIVRENGDETISLADTDECQLTQGASLLYVANMPGDDNQTGVTLPERFYCYTLTIEANIGFLGDGTTPTTGWTLGEWNDIIDTGSAVLDAIGEDSAEVAVTLTLNDDVTVIPGTFEFRNENLTIDGDGHALAGTIEYTDHAGVLTDVTLGTEDAPLTFDLTGVTGPVQLGDDIAITNVEVVLTPEQAQAGHIVFQWDDGVTPPSGTDDVTVHVEGSDEPVELIWDEVEDIAYVGPGVDLDSYDGISEDTAKLISTWIHIYSNQRYFVDEAEYAAGNTIPEAKGVAAYIFNDKTLVADESVDYQLGISAIQSDSATQIRVKIRLLVKGVPFNGTINGVINLLGKETVGGDYAPLEGQKKSGVTFTNGDSEELTFTVPAAYQVFNPVITLE